MDTSPLSTPEAAYTLDATGVRVLGVLIEKSFITPDSYPLSLNALVAGCNQLTARDPVMQVDEASAQAALDTLVGLRLAAPREQSGARVVKYEHQIRLRHSLTPPQQAVLALLLLRGPQTAGELRQRSERMHRFGDIAEVEAVLEQLAEKFPSLAMALPRTPGTKETRHAHLLAGAPEVATAPASTPVRADRVTQLENEVAELRHALQQLQAEFARFRQQFD